MNDFQIKCFMTVVKYMSFSKAASQLYITQPAISRHISNLEKGLGLLLFNRSGKNITLTEAGECFHSFFKTVCKDLCELQAQFSRRDEALKGTVKYTVFPGWNMSDILFDNTKRIYGIHPNLIIEQKFDRVNPCEQLLEGAIDAVFHRYGTLSDVPDIECIKLINIPQVILYSNQHRLSGKEQLHVSDFKNEVFIYLSDEILTHKAVHKRLSKIFLPYGFKPKIEPALDYESMMLMVECCYGVTVMDIITRACNSPKLLALELNSPGCMGLAWKKDNDSPTLKTFIDETITYFEELKPLFITQRADKIKEHAVE